MKGWKDNESEVRNRSRVRIKNVFRGRGSVLITQVSDPAAGGRRKGDPSCVITSHGRRSVSHAGIFLISITQAYFKLCE